MSKLSQSIIDRMQFSISNGHASIDAKVAIATGNLDTMGVATTISDGNATSTIHHHNNTALAAAGFNADTIMDDATVSVRSANVVMRSLNGKDFLHCKEYLKHNPRNVKRITIAATDTASGSKDMRQQFERMMEVASINPFQTEAVRQIDLSQYFSPNQYQGGKIVIDYNDGDLQWNDMLYWAISVMPGCMITVTVDFYNE